MPDRFAQSRWSLEKTLVVTAILGLTIGATAPKFVKAESPAPPANAPKSVLMFTPAVHVTSGGKIERLDLPRLSDRVK
jgi:hypothetical protein